MARHLLTLAGSEPLLTPIADALGARLHACPDPAGLFGQARALAGQAMVAVFGPDAARPLPLARQVAALAPECRFVFLVEPEAEAALRREAAYAAPPGGRWSIASAGGADAQAAIAAELAAAEQQGRLRTTLDRMRLRMHRTPPMDAGEYRRLVASDRYLASVLRHAQDGIVSLDAAGRVVSWNAGAERLLGLPAAQAQRRPLSVLLHSREAAAAIDVALDGGARSVEFEIGPPDARRFVDGNFGALRDEGEAVTGVVAILRDVTARRRAEDELRAGSRQKDEFLAMLAHELRNPLAPIRNATRILERVEGLDPRARQAADVIARQADHMAVLIDDLLDVARVTRGAVELDCEVVAVADVALDAVEQARGLMEARRQAFATSGDGRGLHVLGDRKRLTQVLANLLVNAAKYTPEGGAITLELRGSGDEVVMAVADTGIGMDAGLVDRVFDLFVQGERTPDRAQGGLGVGLALVRTLVAMHGGSVCAHSAGPGLGSRFEVRLPRAPRPGPAGEPERLPADASTPLRPLHILVVDDNADAAETLGLLLGELGHRVEVLVDPRAVEPRVAARPPDACILDLGMPHVDGYELARRIRALPLARQPLLLALTGYGQAGDRRRSREAGFDHHLLKPLDPAALAALLQPLRSTLPAAPPGA